MTKTYLMLDAVVNIDGMTFPVGPRLSLDDHWTRALQARGAKVITEQQYTELTAEAADTAGSEAVPALRNGEAESGTHDTGDGRGNQGTVADFLRSARPGRNHRRNTRGR